MDPFLVNQTRWSDLIKKLAVAKGIDHVEVLAQLSAAIVLENDRPEHKYIGGEALAWGQYLLAALGAGIVGYVGLQNPVGSGKLLVVEMVMTKAQVLSHHYLALARAAVVTPQNTEQPRDTRIQPTGAFGTAAPQIAGQIVSARSDTIVVTPFVTAEFFAGMNAGATLAAIANFIWTFPIVLGPGDQLFTFLADGAGSTVANSRVQASFAWRERTLEPTET